MVASARLAAATAATAGLVAGFAIKDRLDRSKIHADSPPLCGVYELKSAWHGTDTIGVTETPQERRDALVDHRRQCMPRRISGLLVYQEDGRMWTQYTEQNSGAPARYTGYAGRWWLHAPNSGSLLGTSSQEATVEHHVRSASDPSLVGKTVTQQWALSADGQRLTTTDVQILFGEASVVEQLEWRRVAV